MRGVQAEIEVEHVTQAKSLDEEEEDRYLRLRKSRREKILANIKAAEEFYKVKPLNAQNLKRWASALTAQACSIPAENEQVLQSLRDAKSKLDEAFKLEEPEEDYEFKFQLAMSFYYIVKKDNSLKQYDDTYMKLCHQAIGFFKEVQEKASEVYKGSMLEKMQSFLPNGWSDSEDEETDEMGEKPIMVLNEEDIVKDIAKLFTETDPDDCA